MAGSEPHLKLVERTDVRHYCPRDSSTCYEREDGTYYCATCQKLYADAPPPAPAGDDTELQSPPLKLATPVAATRCANCGAETIDSNAQYCPRCGKPLGPIARFGNRSRDGAVAAAPPPAIVAATPSRGPNPHQQFVIILMVVIVLVSGLSSLLFRRAEEQQHSRGTTTTPPAPPAKPPPQPAAPVAEKKPERPVATEAKPPQRIRRPRSEEPKPAPEIIATLPVETPAVPVPEPLPVPTVREGDLVALSELSELPKRQSVLGPQKCPYTGIRRSGGTVKVALLISESGAVEDSRVAESSGKAVLDDAALILLRDIRYTSPIKDGVRVKTWIEVEITYDCRWF